MSDSSDWQRFSSLVLRSSDRLTEYEARGLRNLGVPHLCQEDWKWMGKNWNFFHHFDYGNWIVTISYGYSKIHIGKFRSRKISNLQTLPGKFIPEKIHPRKFPPGIFLPISLIVFLHLTLRPWMGERVYIYIYLRGWKTLILPLWLFSWNFGSINNIFIQNNSSALSLKYKVSTHDQLTNPS